MHPSRAALVVAIQVVLVAPAGAAGRPRSPVGGALGAGSDPADRQEQAAQERSPRVADHRHARDAGDRRWVVRIAARGHLVAVPVAVAVGVGIERVRARVRCGDEDSRQGLDGVRKPVAVVVRIAASRSPTPRVIAGVGLPTRPRRAAWPSRFRSRTRSLHPGATTGSIHRERAARGRCRSSRTRRRRPTCSWSRR